MIKEVVLRDFPSWDSEKQLEEYQAYKALGDYSPFSEEDYKLMEVIMNNHNAEIEVECENGICELIESKDDLLIEGIETTSIEDVFNNLLSNKRVKAGIRKHINTSKLLKIYRTILPMLKDDEIKQHLKTILKKINSAEQFKGWEKILSKRIPIFTNRLKKLAILKSNEEEGDYIQFDLDVITPSLVKRYKKLAALLLLDLTSFLTQKDKKNFYNELNTILDDDNIISTDTESFDDEINVNDLIYDEIETTDKVDKVGANTGLTDEEQSEKDEADLEALRNVITSLSLDSFKANKDEFTLSYKGLSGETDDVLNNSGTSGIDFFNAQNPDNKMDSFSIDKAKERLSRDYIDGEKANILADINLSKEIKYIISIIESGSIAVIKSGLDSSSRTSSSSQTKKALQFIANRLGATLSETKEKDLIVAFIELISKDNPEKLDKSVIDNITSINNEVTASLKKNKDTLAQLEIGSSDNDYILIQKMIKLARDVKIDISYQDMKIFFDDYNSEIPLSEKAFPHPSAIPDLLNKSYTFMIQYNKNTLIGSLATALLEFGKTGEGRGEKFVQFVLVYSFSGKQHSYDIKIAKQAYEIKTYTVNGTNISDSIRLGQEGNIFKSDKFARLFTFILDLQIIFDNTNDNFELLNIIMSNAVPKDVYDHISFLLNDNKASKHVGGNSSKYSLVEQLRKGEFSESQMKLFNATVILVKSVLSAITKNNFYFMKIYLQDGNIDLAIKPIGDTMTKINNSKKADKIEFEIVKPFDKKVESRLKSAILRILGSSEIINNPEYLKEVIEDGMSIINKEFIKHPMILINDFKKKKGGTPTIVCSGVYTNFTFDQITQTGFKIIPSGLTKKK